MRAQEQQTLNGTWRFVSREEDGQPMSPEQLQPLRLVRKGNQWWLQVAGQTVTYGTLQEDPAQDPKTVDVTIVDGPVPGEKGATLPGIYRAEGNRFTQCNAPPGRPRPTEFTSPPGSGNTLVVYEREPSP